MKTRTQITLITLVFASLYPFLRALPDAECVFLHYESVDEKSEGSELCGLDNRAFFLDLRQLYFPVELKVVNETKGFVGKEQELRLKLNLKGRGPLVSEDLAIVHTEKVHLFVIGPNLDDYHHLHPTPDSQPGYYRVPFTPHRAGTYKIFAEMVPLQSASLVVGESSITVLENAKSSDLMPIEHRTALAVERDNYRFELIPQAEGAWQPNQEQLLTLKVSHLNNYETIAFEQIMGAYAHLVAFDQGRNGLAHLHPLNEGQGLGTAEAQFSFSFSTYLEDRYKVWAQVKIEGKEYLVPFDYNPKKIILASQ